MSKLGIWMDHKSAHVMEFTADTIETKTIDSKASHEGKDSSENRMHSKEQHVQAEYFKTLADIIKNYESVVLFGPTDAKSELLNILKDDQHFSKIKIEMKSADKMTENQEHAFVKAHFGGH